MHGRHRSPGNGYRSSPSSGMASSRISPETSLRAAHPFHEYRSFNRSSSSNRPNSSQLRKGDIFVEAGRLAAEYLVSHGLLPPNVLSSKWQNGSSFKRILRQEAEGQEGRPSALARLGNANSNADASPSTRRRFVADEFPSLPFKTPFRGRRRPGYNRAYASDWAGKDFSRSVSFQDRFSDADEDTFSDHQGTRNGADDMPQKSLSNVDLASKTSPPDSQPTELDNPTSSAWNDSSEITQEPQKTSDDLRTDKVKDCASSNSIDEIDKKEENVVKDLDFPKALEGESTSNNTSDLLTSLTMCKFAKVPTRIRSSLTSKSQKLDPTEASVTSSHSKIQVLVDDGSPLGQSVGELGRVYNLRDSRCERSLSLPPDRAFVSDDERELSQGPLQYSSADKDNERGEKRALEDGDMQEGAKRPRDWLPSVVVEAGGCFNLSNSSEKNVSSHEDGASYGDGANVDVDNENLMVSNSQFSKDGGERHIDFSQEKRLFPSSFKICDLNLMEASETHENHNGDPIMIYPALSEIKREAAPVDVDLSINNSNVSGEKSKRPGDGKEIEVIDLENDSAQEDKDLVLVEVKKPETVYTDLEGFPNHAQNTGDIPDVQDGYLMISELLGNEFPTSVPEHINPMHNDIGLHNGEGALGDDDSIYMSLGEIPLTFLRPWEQPPPQEYEKPF